MARTVSVGKLQEMQRENVDPPPGFRAPALSVPEQLRALTLQDDIAGMPLGQVVGLIRLAVAEKHVNATEQEIRIEAERRWLDGKIEETPVDPKPEDRTDGEDQNYVDLAGPESDETGQGESEHPFVESGGSQRVYDVAPDGIVEGVRPADMTPDRGPDVGETHHTITDDEPRFSGGGAEDDDESDRFPVPSDISFANKLFADAPELANIAEKLIGEHGYLDNLRACRVRYLWKRKTGVSKGRLKIGYIARVSGLLAHAYPGVDFVVWLSAMTAREARFSPLQIEAAVLHQLCHVGEDDNGNWIKMPHDFEGFAAEVRSYGVWTQDLKVAQQAFSVAQQMGLFDEDGDDDDTGEIDADDLEDLP